jgi:hypothetical protein
MISRTAWRLLAVATLVGIAAVVAATAAPVSLAYGCQPQGKASTAFGSWGDNTDYLLSGGGSFEPGAPSWSLSQGATVQSGNEPWHVEGASDSHSLSLPAGSSATSVQICSPKLYPVIRFFVANLGSPDGRLHVELIVNGDSRGSQVLDGGTVTASGGWNVTAPIAVPWRATHSGAVAFQVRLTPVGDGSAFAVDDVFIDPYQSR